MFFRKKTHLGESRKKIVVSEIPLRKGGSRNNSSDTVICFRMEDGEIVIQNIAFQKSMFVG